MHQYHNLPPSGPEKGHSQPTQRYLRPKLDKMDQGAVIKKVGSQQDLRQGQQEQLPGQAYPYPGVTATAPAPGTGGAERVQSPSPSTNTLSSLRKPLSRIFKRRKSKASIYGAPCDMPSLPSGAFPPIAEAPPSTSVFEDDRPSGTRSPFKAKTLPKASKIPLISTQSPTKDGAFKPPKAKRSFSALSSLFRGGSHSPSKSNVPPPLERVFSPPILPMPNQPRSPSSMAQLFDLAHADVEDMLDGREAALSYSLGPGIRYSLAVPTTSPSLMKARSTPDLYGHARKFSAAASLHINTPPLGIERDPVPSVPSSPLTSRMPTPLPPSAALSSRFPVSPSLSNGSFGLGQSTSRVNRSKSPLLPTMAFPSSSGLPSVYETAPTSETALGQLSGPQSGSATMPYLATPTPPSPEKLPLSARIVKDRDFRPTTAGTFGRPHTGKSMRPDTAGSYRPDTGVSLRPDTGMSLSDFTNKPGKQRLDGRMRFKRISGLSAELSDDEEDDRHSEYGDEDEDGRNLEEGGPEKSFLNEEAQLELSEGMTRDDSGFSDGTALESYTRFSTTLVSPSSLSLFANVKRASTSASFRPPIADTYQFPANLPDVDSSFNPKASLGSIAAQSSVSILSDFERSLDERMNNWRSEEDGQEENKLNAENRAKHEPVASPTLSAAPVPESPAKKRELLFGSIVAKRLAEMGIDNHRRTWAESSQSASSRAQSRRNTDPDITPVKSKLLLLEEEDTPSPIITRRFGTEEEATEVMKNSVSSSEMSRIMARRHLEDSIFLKHTLTFSRAFARDGVHSVQTRDAITQTDSDDLLDQSAPFTPSAPTRITPATHGHGHRYSSSTAALSSFNRALNSPLDPFAQSYFPPVHTLAVPLAPMPSPASTKAGMLGTPMCGFSEVEKDKIIEQLKEALEKETQRREMLEYALAAQKAA